VPASNIRLREGVAAERTDARAIRVAYNSKVQKMSTGQLVTNENFASARCVCYRTKVDGAHTVHIVCEVHVWVSTVCITID